MEQQRFADDSQIRRSSQPSDIDQTVLNVQDNGSDIRYWMTDNKLQPNEDKTEEMLFNSSKLQDALASLSICQTTVTFSDSVRNLGFYLDKDLSMKQHINFICKQLSFNFVDSALFNSTSQVMTQRLLLSLLYCPGLTIAILS